MNIWSVPERVLATTHEVVRGIERSTRRMHARVEKLSGSKQAEPPESKELIEPKAGSEREREYLDRVREVMAENRRLLDAVGSDAD